MAPRAENPRDSKNHKIPTWKKLLAGGAALASLNALAGCNSTEVGAVPKPNETTPTTSAPATPGEIDTTPSESTPSPTITSTPETPAPSITETAQNNVPEVPPFREWNIAPNTGERLLAAESDQEKWAIIKEVIVNNNEPGTYEGDTTLHTRSVEGMFNRANIELATMSDIAIDPNATDGDIISKTWADIGIIDEDFRFKFVDITSNMRTGLSTLEQEWVDGLLEIQKEEPLFQMGPEILHASEKIDSFYDPITGKDYNGSTFTTYYVSPYPEVITFTVVFDFENSATQILREYPESTPGGWEIVYNNGEAPIKVSEIPAVQDVINP